MHADDLLPMKAMISPDCPHHHHQLSEPLRHNGVGCTARVLPISIGAPPPTLGGIAACPYRTPTGDREKRGGGGGDYSYGVCGSRDYYISAAGVNGQFGSMLPADDCPFHGGQHPASRNSSPAHRPSPQAEVGPLSGPCSPPATRSGGVEPPPEYEQSSNIYTCKVRPLGLLKINETDFSAVSDVTCLGKIKTTDDVMGIDENDVSLGISGSRQQQLREKFYGGGSRLDRRYHPAAQNAIYYSTTAEVPLLSDTTAVGGVHFNSLDDSGALQMSILSSASGDDSVDLIIASDSSRQEHVGSGKGGPQDR